MKPFDVCPECEGQFKETKDFATCQGCGRRWKIHRPLMLKIKNYIKKFLS